jgi:hypothetical protein
VRAAAAGGLPVWSDWRISVLLLKQLRMAAGTAMQNRQVLLRRNA